MLQERKNPTQEELESAAKEIKYELGKPLEKPELSASGMLSRAEKIVDERMKKYGVPTESWTRIGRMWGAYLNIADIPAEMCLQMMTMVKKIRERYEHHPDNWEDDAGYVDCAHRVMQAKKDYALTEYDPSLRDKPWNNPECERPGGRKDLEP